MNNNPIYLDHAATTPLREEVKQVMMEMLNGPHGNPSSQHQFGRKSKVLVETARKNIARYMGCTPKEIIFTSGGTEADNAALHLAVRDLGVQRIITSPLEHNAVLNTAELLERKGGVQIDWVRHDANGVLDLEYFKELLAQDIPTLVSLMHGNNEIGNLLDLQRVGGLCKKHGAYFHSDTVQTVGHFELNLAELPVDFITASAHKFYGPKGVGFLYVRDTVKIESFVTGGGQERGHRGGTENVLSIVAMQKALETSLDNLTAEKEHMEDLKAYFLEKLKREVGDVRFNGLSEQPGQSLYSVLSVCFDKAPGEMLLFNLDLHGVAASGGSACSSGSLKGSHVLQCLHPGDTAPVVRFSFGKDNTKEELDRVIAILREILEKDAVAGRPV